MPDSLRGGQMGTAFERIRDLYAGSRSPKEPQENNQVPERETMVHKADTKQADFNTLLLEFGQLLGKVQDYAPVNIAIARSVANKIVTLRSLKDTIVSEISLAKHQVDLVNLQKSFSEYMKSHEASDPLSGKISVNFDFHDEFLDLSGGKAEIQNKAVAKTKASLAQKWEIQGLAGSLSNLQQRGWGSVGRQVKDVELLMSCLRLNSHEEMWRATLRCCMEQLVGVSGFHVDGGVILGAASDTLMVEFILAQSRNDDPEAFMRAFLPKVLFEFSEWRARTLLEDDNKGVMMTHESLRSALGHIRPLTLEDSPNLVAMEATLRSLYDAKTRIEQEVSGSLDSTGLSVLFNSLKICLADMLALLFPEKIDMMAQLIMLDQGVFDKDSPNNIVTLDPPAQEVIRRAGLRQFVYEMDGETVPVFDVGQLVEESWGFIIESAKGLRESLQPGLVGCAVQGSDPGDFFACMNIMGLTFAVWRLNQDRDLSQYIRMARRLALEDRVECQKVRLESLAQSLNATRTRLQEVSEEVQLLDEEYYKTRFRGNSALRNEEIQNRLHELRPEERSLEEEEERLRGNKNALEQSYEENREALQQQMTLKRQSLHTAVHSSFEAVLTDGAEFIKEFACLFFKDGGEGVHNWHFNITEMQATVLMQKIVSLSKVVGCKLLNKQLSKEQVVEIKEICNRFETKLDEGRDCVTRSCSELHEEDGLRKGISYLAQTLHSVGYALSNSLKNVAAQATLSLKSKERSQLPTQALETAGKAASDICLYGKQLSEHVEGSCNREEMLEKFEAMMELDKKMLQPLEKELWRFKHCRMSLTFTREFLYRFLWVHCQYADERQPMGNFLQDVRGRIQGQCGYSRCRWLFKEEEDMEGQRKRLVDHLDGVAASLCSQLVHAVHAYPTNVLQVVWAFEKSIDMIGEKFLPAAICSQHFFKAILDLITELLSKDGTHDALTEDEAKCLTTILRYCESVLGMDLMASCSLEECCGLMDVRKLQEALCVLCKSLVGKRPGMSKFMNELFIRFRAMKVELAVAYLKTASDNFLDSCVGMENVNGPQQHIRDSKAMDEVGLDTCSFENYRVCDAGDLRKQSLTVQESACPDVNHPLVYLQYFEEMTKFLNESVLGIGASLVQMCKAAPAVLDIHEIVSWYQEASMSCMEALSTPMGELIVGLPMDSDTTSLSSPTIVEQLEKGIQNVLEKMLDGVEVSGVENIVYELQDASRLAEDAERQWMDSGQLLRAERHERCKWWFTSFMSKIRSQWNDFQMRLLEHEKQKQQFNVALDGVWETVGELYGLCSQIGMAGDTDDCSTKVAQVLEECERVKRCLGLETIPVPEEHGFELHNRSVSLKFLELSDGIVPFGNKVERIKAVCIANGGKDLLGERAIELKHVSGAEELSFHIHRFQDIKITLDLEDKNGKKQKTKDVTLENVGKGCVTFDRVWNIPGTGRNLEYNVVVQSQYLPITQEQDEGNEHGQRSKGMSKSLNRATDSGERESGCEQQGGATIGFSHDEESTRCQHGSSVANMAETIPEGETAGTHHLGKGEAVGNGNLQRIPDHPISVSSSEYLEQLKGLFCAKFKFLMDKVHHLRLQQSGSKPLAPETPEDVEQRGRHTMSKKEEEDNAMFMEMKQTGFVRDVPLAICCLGNTVSSLLTGASDLLVQKKMHDIPEQCLGMVMKLISDLEKGEKQMVQYAGRQSLWVVNLADRDIHQNSIQSMWTPEMKAAFERSQGKLEAAMEMGRLVLLEVFRLVLTGAVAKASKVSNCHDFELLQKQLVSIDELQKSLTGKTQKYIFKTFTSVHGKPLAQSIQGIAAFMKKRIQYLENMDNLRKSLYNIDKPAAGCLSGTQLAELGQITIVEGPDIAALPAPQRLALDFGAVLHDAEQDASSKKARVERTVRVVNRTGMEIAFRLAKQCSSAPNFQVFPLHARLYPDTSIDITCTVDKSQVGDFEETWTLESDNLGREANLVLKAKVQALHVEFSKQKLDLGYFQVKGEKVEREVTVRNATGVAMLLKSVALNGRTKSRICVSPERAVLGPHGQEVFKIGLQIGLEEEDVDGQVVIGVGSSEHLKTLPVVGKIRRPRFKLLSETQGDLANHGNLKIPPVRVGERAVSNLKIQNCGEVPAWFELSSFSASVEVTGRQEGILNPGTTAGVKLGLARATRGREEHQGRLSVEGCQPHHFQIHGCWSNPDLRVKSKKIKIPLSIDKLGDWLLPDGKIKATGIVQVTNSGQVPGSIYAPTGTNVTFIPTQAVVDGDETKDVQVVVEGGMGMLRDKTWHKLELFDDEGNNLPFEIQLNLRCPALEVSSMGLVMCERAISPDEMETVDFTVKNTGSSDLKFTVSIPQMADQLKEVEVYAMRNKAKTSVGIGEGKRQFTLKEGGQMAFHVKFQAGLECGWFQQDIVVQPENDLLSHLKSKGFAGNDLVVAEDCAGGPSEHRVAIQGLVTARKKHPLLGLHGRSGGTMNWSSVKSLGIEIMQELVQEPEQSVAAAMLMPLLPYTMSASRCDSTVHAQVLAGLRERLKEDKVEEAARLFTLYWRKGKLPAEDEVSHSKHIPKAAENFYKSICEGLKEKGLDFVSEIHIPAGSWHGASSVLYRALCMARDCGIGGKHRSWDFASARMRACMPNVMSASALQDACGEVWKLLESSGPQSPTLQEGLDILKETLMLQCSESDLEHTEDWKFLDRVGECLGNGAFSASELLARILENSEIDCGTLSGSLLSSFSKHSKSNVTKGDLVIQMANPIARGAVEKIISGDGIQVLSALATFYDVNFKGANEVFDACIHLIHKVVSEGSGQSTDILRAFGMENIALSMQNLQCSVNDRYTRRGPLARQTVSLMHEIFMVLLPHGSSKELWKRVEKAAEHLAYLSSHSSHLYFREEEELCRILCIENNRRTSSDPLKISESMMKEMKSANHKWIMVYMVDLFCILDGEGSFSGAANKLKAAVELLDCLVRNKWNDRKEELLLALQLVGIIAQDGAIQSSVSAFTEFLVEPGVNNAYGVGKLLVQSFLGEEAQEFSEKLENAARGISEDGLTEESGLALIELISERESTAIAGALSTIYEATLPGTFDCIASIDQLDGLCEETENSISMAQRILTAAEALQEACGESHGHLDVALKLQKLLQTLDECSCHLPGGTNMGIPRESPTIGLFFAIMACIGTRSGSRWGQTAAKINLLLSLAKFFALEQFNSSEALKIQYTAPDIPPKETVESTDEDSVSSEEYEAHSCDPVVDKDEWFPFPEGVRHSSDPTRQSGTAGMGTSQLPPQAMDASSDLEGAKAVEDGILESLSTVQELLQGIHQTLNSIPNELKESQLVPDVLGSLAELRIAATEWMSGFRQACQLVNQGYKISNDKLEKWLVEYGVEMATSVECFRLWMLTGCHGAQSDLTAFKNDILRHLELIPRHNLSSSILDLMRSIKSELSNRTDAFEDFEMQLDMGGVVNGGDMERLGTIGCHGPAGLGLLNVGGSSAQTNRALVDESMFGGSVLGALDDGKEATSTVDPRRTSILKQKVSIDIDMDAFVQHYTSSSDSDAVSDGGEHVQRGGNTGHLGDSGTRSLSVVQHICKKHANVKHSQQVDTGPLQIQGTVEISGPIPEDEEIEALVGNIDIDPKIAESDLKKCDFSKLYSDSRAIRRDVRLAPISDPVNAQPVERQSKWTYQMLAESKPLMKYSRMVLNELRAYQSRFYEKTSEHHVFEWCLLVDNSGSMISKRKQAFEALVVAMETLRHLEFPFAVARFGSEKNQRMLKLFTDNFSNQLGQMILEAFSYNESTYPASAVANVAEKIWPHSLGEIEKCSRHRIMLMIVDGLTRQIESMHYTNVTSSKDIELVVLNIKDGSQEKMMQQIHKLWSSATSCYDVLDIDEIDHLPSILAGLMIKQLEKTLKEASTKEASKGLEHQKTAMLPPRLPLNGHIWPLVENIGQMDLSNASATGVGSCPRNLFEVSVTNSDIPFIDQARQNKVVVANDGTDERLQRAIDGVHHFHEGVRSSSTSLKIVQKAEYEWEAAASKISHQIDDMVEALEGALEINKFTRNKACERGTSLHLQGLIKAVMTQFNYKKYFSARKSGGKRDYGITLLLDVSMSMNGHLAQCSMETLVMIVEALVKMGIENFSIVLFGQRLYPVKLPGTAWDGASMAALLNTLNYDNEYASLDADAIEFALDLFHLTNSRGPKKIFVLTDGFGTSGLKLARALERAEDELVDVLALAVGFENFFVETCYSKWVKSVLPCAVPNALRTYYEQTMSLGSGLTVNHNMDEQVDWTTFAPFQTDAEETVDDVLSKHREVFPDLLKQLQGERDIKIKTGNMPDVMTVDLCFVIDCTGSMSPWIAAAKAQIQAITGGIIPRVNKEYKGIKIQLRHGAVAYRDYGDVNQVCQLRFTDDDQNLVTFLHSQKAEGGGDGPEDVLGAIHAALQWDDWTSRIKFMILITDSPAHGRDCNQDPGDRYPGGDPAGNTVKALMKEMKRKEIDFMFCKIKDQATRLMEQQFKLHYDDKAADRKLTTADLFDASQVPVGLGGFHIVFCLDESSSMGGEPWSDLTNAYNLFIRRRINDQGNGDIVSVVQFNCNARIVHGGVRIESSPKLASQRGGGTYFVPPLETAKGLLGNYPNYTPLLVFMSDGAADDASILMRQIYHTHASKGIQIHTVGFGSGASHGTLRNMAQAGNGRHHAAVDGIELSRVFANIAAGCNAMDGLVSRFGEIISGMVATKIMDDRL